MIALKNDPAWCKISAFALPFTPFDYEDEMIVRNVDRDEMQKLGLPLQNPPSIVDFPSALYYFDALPADAVIASDPPVGLFLGLIQPEAEDNEDEDEPS